MLAAGLVLAQGATEEVSPIGKVIMYKLYDILY